MDTEGTYCAIVANPEYLSQWQGPNATYTMHLEVPCDTGARASLLPQGGNEQRAGLCSIFLTDAHLRYCAVCVENAGSLVNRSGYLIGGTVSKYARPIPRICEHVLALYLLRLLPGTDVVKPAILTSGQVRGDGGRRGMGLRVRLARWSSCMVGLDQAAPIVEFGPSVALSSIVGLAQAPARAARAARGAPGRQADHAA